jgi:D-alanine-D-alanine ligase
LLVGFTYNIKKDIETAEALNENVPAKNQYINNTLAEKYSHRLSDKYAEWDDEETISAVEAAIKKAGHEVIRIEADENAYEKLKAVRPDIVFNMAEGFGGASRESHIPAILEMLNIPYTASDPVTIGNCHDKARCKEILSYHNIPTPKFFITETSVNGHPRVNYPAFVKPLHEGSSKGIYNSSLVQDKNELNKEIYRIKSDYSQPSIIEDYLDGKEFTVALLGNGENTRVLPIVEINMNTLPENFPKIYSYEVKWYFDTRENKLDIFTCPAKISEKLKNRIEEICLNAYKALRIKDWARMDVRCDADGNPSIIEVNPLPGILPNPDDNSCFPKAARQVGIDYENLVQTVLNLAIERYGLKQIVNNK